MKGRPANRPHHRQSADHVMLFNSYAVLFAFLPAAILIYWLADGSPRWRTWVLILLSLVFYGYWDVRFVPLLIGSILVNWWAANLYALTRRHAIVTVAVIANLVVLGIFKYTNFFADTFSAVFGLAPTHFQIILPLGISFFTFHHIMYLVDLGRGRAPTYPLDRYALYICFFPQAIAGPIARWNEVIHQFGHRVFTPGWEQRCALGATFIVIGLMQKVLLADPIGNAIDPIYSQALNGPIPDGRAWMALAFAFQVFFDFAGYSDIAIGLALIFGIQLPPNFDAPFRATSIIDFWQRWHMTLTRFLRDYVFTPLVRAQIRGREHRLNRALLAILLTMALCGLWHGAGWTFVLWGTLQGVAIVFAAVWTRYLPSPPAIVGWAATVGFFVLSIVLFRAGSLDAALRIYRGLMSWPIDRPNGINTLIVAVVVATALPPSYEICRRLVDIPYRVVAAALAAATVVVLICIGGQQNHEFVYFQF
jgi:D-alanyl-lipoteichoic acid acyltransferase DltB (MBOAT superfamily)